MESQIIGGVFALVGLLAFVRPKSRFFSFLQASDSPLYVIRLVGIGFIAFGIYVFKGP